MAKVIRRRLIDRFRSARSSQEREHDVATRHRPEPRPSETAQAGELWERMLSLCPPQHRTLLLLKQQGMGLDDIAARTGLHPGSVRRVLYDLARRLAVQAGEPDRGGAPTVINVR